ncbi:MAG: hypothetical protein Q7S80_02240, partial [bacterium]|nr:hypothetical protein [bacterium]
MNIVCILSLVSWLFLSLVGETGLGHGYFSAEKFLDPGSDYPSSAFQVLLLFNSPSSKHKLCCVLNLVGETGLEPARDCSHSHLKAACIPIST